MNTRFELMREHIDLKKAASVGLLGDVVDKLVEELAKLSQRIKELEAEAAKPRHTMTFAGDWIEGFEYSVGDVVLYGDSMFVCVQAREPASPPSRYTGWVQLTGA